jgi:hypothetical protein
MFPSACIAVFAPLTLAAVLAALATAVMAKARDAGASQIRRRGGQWLAALALAGAVVAVISHVRRADWVHDFWAVQVPIVGLFLGSGLFLCRTWSADAELFATWDRERRGRRAERVPLEPNPAWCFLGIMLLYGVGSILLRVWDDASARDPRGAGNPFVNLFALAGWGFGGALPGFLEPEHAAQIERGVGHLPRDVTVPMGTSLIAAWLWILFVGLALASRLLPRGGARAFVVLLAPHVLGMLAFVASFTGTLHGAVLDPRYFLLACESSGIWTSDPLTMRTYGPVLLAALASAFVLAAALHVDRRIGAARDDAPG